MNDRLLRAARREPVDRTPVWFMRQAGRSQPEYRALRERHTLVEIVRRPELCAEVTLRPVEELGVDAAVLFADIMLPLRSMGVGFELSDGGPRIDRPVRTPADLAALKAFAVDELITAVLETIRLVRRSTNVPLIGFSGAPFTLASYLIEGGPSRDYVLTKTVMYRAPELWHGLMERLTEMVLAYLREQIAAGVQAVQVFDSWVGCLSPADYTQYVASYSRAIFAGLAGSGVPTIHFGTATAGLLEEMAEAGGDVVGVDWRIDLAAAWDRITPKRAIQGNLEPAVLLAEPEVIVRRTREVLDGAAGRAGHIFNLGHGVLPQTPRAHLRLVVDIVHQYGAVREGTLR